LGGRKAFALRPIKKLNPHRSQIRSLLPMRNPQLGHELSDGFLLGEDGITTGRPHSGHFPRRPAMSSLTVISRPHSQLTRITASYLPAIR
jgi:hypothetical protein